MDEKLPSNPQFVFFCRVDPDSQSVSTPLPRGRQAEEVWTPALTTWSSPSTGAPLAAAQSRSLCPSSCSTSLPQRYQGGPGLRGRRLQLLLPGC